MFVEEAIWISEILEKIGLQKGQTVLNLGSSTEAYRSLEQPFIDYYIFRPLREKGIRIVHLDKKNGGGVDWVCDLTSSEFIEQSKTVEPADLVLCTSLLEHVPDRELVLERIKLLAKKNGVIILSVPYVFRYHADPIDTLYRPSNSELEAFFPPEEYTRIASDVIPSSEKFFYRPKSLLFRIANRILRQFPTNRQLEWSTNLTNKVSILAVQKNHVGAN